MIALLLASYTGKNLIKEQEPARKIGKASPDAQALIDCESD